MLVGAHDAVEVESELSEVVVLDRELELGEERERGEGGRDGRVRGRKEEKRRKVYSSDIWCRSRHGYARVRA